MPTSEILQDKRILAVSGEGDVLDIIDEELSLAGGNATLHAASTFEEACQYLLSHTYDLMLLDVEWILRGFDLLQRAHNVGIPTVMLTWKPFSREDVGKCVEMGARACLPAEKLGSLTLFLEDVLKLSYQDAWKNSLDQAGTLFNERFGSEWRKTREEF